MTTHELSALRQLYVTQEPFINAELDAALLIDLLKRIKSEEIIEIIKENSGDLRHVTAANIPQFSQVDDIYKVLRVVIDSGRKDLDFRAIGSYLRPKKTKPGAQTKYGENHYKLAHQLGLTTIKRPFAATDLGLAFYLIENSEERTEITKKLALRVPIIQQALLTAEHEVVDMNELMRKFLSESTVTRRRSNVRKLLCYIMDNAEVELQHTLNNIIWR